MGLKYNKNDGQLFISAMNHNVSSANEIVSRLNDGSDHLISMVNGGSAQLSGKAYNAVGTLFTSIVQPVLSKLESATEDIKSDIQVFQSQSSAFNAFNDTIYDEEKLNHLKEIKQQQQATVVTQIGMFNNSLLGDLAKNVAEELFYEGKRLENVAEHYANEIKEIDDKLRILHEFSSSTSHLFQDSLTVFQSAMQGVKALNQGRFDSNGNFSMPAGSDMSWYNTLTNQKLDSALVSDDEAEREELLKGLDVKGLTDKDRHKYESSVSDILKTLQEQGWTKEGLEAYLKTLATINSKSHSAGDVFPIDSLIENAQLMKFLLDNASHLDVSKYVEKGWEWEKTNTYYFINGEPNFVLTQLGAYLPNFNVTKQASSEEMASVSKVVQDEVVTPQNGFLYTAELLEELSKSGVKYSVDDTIMATKTLEGKIAWLEVGKEGERASGLAHILKDHASQFLDIGVSQEQIPDLLKSALSKGEVVGTLGKGATPRIVYRVNFNGKDVDVAIQVGSNGYIVGANPTSKFK